MFDKKEYMKNWWKNNQDKAKEYKKKHGQRCSRITHAKRIQFKDKRIYLKQNPRTGICSNCGKIGLTHIHHVKYHDEDPLKDTIELCPGCHIKLR